MSDPELLMQQGFANHSPNQRDIVSDRMLRGDWDREVMSSPRPEPNRAEVTPDLIRIMDWAYKNRIEISLKHHSGRAFMRFKRGDRHRDLNAPNLREIYREVKFHYREIFSELRCPQLNLEG